MGNSFGQLLSGAFGNAYYTSNTAQGIYLPQYQGYEAQQQMQIAPAWKPPVVCECGATEGAVHNRGCGPELRWLNKRISEMRVAL